MRRLLRACACVLVTLIAPGVASAQQLTSIDGSPLNVYTDGLGATQITIDGQEAGVFYNPFSVKLGFGPHAGFEAIVDGTAFQLGVYRVNTVPAQVIDLGVASTRQLVSEYDLQVTGAPPTLHVKETLTYVNQSPIVGVQYDITNVTGAPVGVRAGMLGDIYSDGNDVGSGQLLNEGGVRIVSGIAPTGAQTGITEADPPWNAYQEGLYSNVFANFVGAGLDNSVDPTAVDNAVAAQWDLAAVLPGETRTISTGWVVQRGTLTPELGKSVLATTSKGRVRVKLPRSSKYVDLTSLRELPLGTTFDTTKGQVTLTSAANPKGATQKGWFYEGVFKIGQTKGAKPLTTLAMAGSKPSCGKGKRAQASKKRSRRLWGDGKGRFQTKGQFSSATVRGTKWLVQDRCDGTLTKVVEGSVAVRDFAKRKTVVVKAGRSYLARKPG